MAIYALDVAREAKSAAAAAAGVAATPAAHHGQPSAAAAPAPTPTPSRTPQFVPEMVRASVPLPAPQGCGAVYFDVDNLQVGALAGHEFYLSSCLGTPQVRIDNTSGSHGDDRQPVAPRRAPPSWPGRPGRSWCCRSGRA